MVDRRVLRLCRNPGLNQGPLDLQSNALPTELFRPTIDRGPAHDQYRIHVAMINNIFTPEQHEVRTSDKCVSIGGSVVECSPATRAARVRFPADATFDSNTNSKLRIIETVRFGVYVWAKPKAACVVHFVRQTTSKTPPYTWIHTNFLGSDEKRLSPRRGIEPRSPA